MSGWEIVWDIVSGTIKNERFRMKRMNVYMTFKRMNRLRMGSQPERKRKNFIRLGIGIGQAYSWSRTRLGGWAVAQSPMLGTTITISRLKRQGYESMIDYHSKFRISNWWTAKREWFWRKSESERLNVFLKWVNLYINWGWEGRPVLFLRTEPSVPSSDVHLVHLVYRLHSVIVWEAHRGLYCSRLSTRLPIVVHLQLYIEVYISFHCIKYPNDSFYSYVFSIVL